MDCFEPCPISLPDRSFRLKASFFSDIWIPICILLFQLKQLITEIITDFSGSLGIRRFIARQLIEVEMFIF
jgi:hypothetical protein